MTTTTITLTYLLTYLLTYVPGCFHRQRITLLVHRVNCINANKRVHEQLDQGCWFWCMSAADLNNLSGPETRLIRCAIVGTEARPGQTFAAAEARRDRRQLPRSGFYRRIMSRMLSVLFCCCRHSRVLSLVTFCCHVECLADSALQTMYARMHQPSGRSRRRSGNFEMAVLQVQMRSLQSCR